MKFIVDTDSKYSVPPDAVRIRNESSYTPETHGDISYAPLRWIWIVRFLDANVPNWADKSGRPHNGLLGNLAIGAIGRLRDERDTLKAQVNAYGDQLAAQRALVEGLKRELELHRSANVRVIYYPRNGVPYICEHKQPPAEMGGAMTFHVRAQQPERVHVRMPPRYAGKMPELGAPYGNCQPHVDAPVKHADGRVEYPQWESSYTKRVVDQLNEAHNDDKVPYIPSLAAAVQAALALLKDYHQTQHQVYEYCDIARKEAATARTELETWKKRAMESVRAILRQVNVKLDELRKVS